MKSSSGQNDATPPPTPRASAKALSRRRRKTASVSRVGKLGGLSQPIRPAPDGSLADADRLRKTPRLRLVGADPDTTKRATPALRLPAGQVVKPAITPPQHDPITDTADPRWVLAVRTAEQLEGSILRPERREALLRMGKLFGLTPFDANLVLAIVQDQARRGHAPAYCPAAGEPQLRMVPPPRRRPWSIRRWLTLGAAVAAFTAVEIAVLAWYFGG